VGLWARRFFTEAAPSSTTTSVLEPG
jgi:hypothetical protein